MQDIILNAEKSHSLHKEDIIKLLADNSFNDLLFKTADNIRKKFVGDEIHLRALIEFSNICKRNCFYCGIRSGNKKIERYRLSEKEILDAAKSAVNLGFKTIVLQSGEDDFYSTDFLCKIISEIKKMNIAITLGIGEKSFEEYSAYKKAGADRFLLRIETTDENLYKKMHPNMSLENRKNCLYNLKKAGFEVGCGCLVGLPNQTLSSLADDILFFKEIDADMIGIGPFIPHPDTPLKEEHAGDFTLALKVMAITRLLLPDINIPATTAMETLNPNGRILALQSGANVIMPNILDTIYKQKYEIYPNKAGTNDNAEDLKNSFNDKIKSIGRSISTDYGFHKRGRICNDTKEI